MTQKYFYHLHVNMTDEQGCQGSRERNTKLTTNTIRISEYNESEILRIKVLYHSSARKFFIYHNSKYLRQIYR
jgi:hypothetical protein